MSGLTTTTMAPLPSDDRIEELYDDAPCGFLSTTADGTLIRVNRTFARWSQREPADMLGERRLAQLLTPGSRLLWLTHHVPQLQRVGDLSAVALDLQLPDGAVMPVLASATLVHRSDLDRPLVRLTAVDARERRVFESELLAARRAAERAQWRVGALQEVTEAAASSTSLHQLLHAVAAAATKGFTATCAGIWITGSRPGSLRLVAAEDLPPEATSCAANATPESALRAWRDATMLHVPSISMAATIDPRLVDELIATDSHGLLAVPLTFNDECLGVVVLYLPENLALDGKDLRTVEMVGTVIGQAMVRTRLHEHLEHTAHHDPLTGLANRSLLDTHLRHLVNANGEVTQPTSLLIIDLDDFKIINDTHGHEVGDAVLTACAKRMAGVVRESHVVARTGGDEFVVVCEATDADMAQKIADRIQATVTRPITVNQLRLRVGASVGIATATTLASWSDVTELLAGGDAAMYAAKRRRKATT